MMKTSIKKQTLTFVVAILAGLATPVFADPTEQEMAGGTALLARQDFSVLAGIPAEVMSAREMEKAQGTHIRLSVFYGHFGHSHRGCLQYSGVFFHGGFRYVAHNHQC